MRDNRGFACHRHTHMTSVEMHHVWPTGYHGPNVKSNLVKICPNAHSDIHDLLERMLRGKPYRPVLYGATVRQIARRGYEQVMAYGERLSADYDG